MLEGDLINLRRSARKILRIAEQHHLPESLGLSHYFLAALHYFRNELPETAVPLHDALENRYLGRPAYFAFCAFIQSLVLTAQGQIREAWDLIESVVDFAREGDYALVLDICRAFKIELALRQGNTAGIEDLMEGVNFSPYPPLWFSFLPQVTELKALMALGRADRLEDALAKSHQLVEFGQSNHNIHLQIQVLSVQALLFSAQGDDTRAFEALARALVLAEPGGFIRTFVDLGRPMADLLKQALTQKISVNYVERILAAFNDEGVRRTPPPGPASPLRHLPTSPSGRLWFPKPSTKRSNTRRRSSLDCRITDGSRN